MVKDTTVSPAGLRIVKLLVGQPPKTVAGLIRSTGVTRTAVTEQLNDLVASGTCRAIGRALAGPRTAPTRLQGHRRRPAVVCQRPAGGDVRPVARRFSTFAARDAAKKILKRVSRAMADHYSQKITAKKPLERLRQLISLLPAKASLSNWWRATTAIGRFTGEVAPSPTWPTPPNRLPHRPGDDQRASSAGTSAGWRAVATATHAAPSRSPASRQRARCYATATRGTRPGRRCRGWKDD